MFNLKSYLSRPLDLILANQQFILYSPSFPFYYTQNLDITWTATTIESRRFLLEFVIFHTEKLFDILQVGGGMDCKHIFNHKFSGDNISDTVITSDHTLCVHFTSDYSVSTTGFMINVTTIGLYSSITLYLCFKMVLLFCPLVLSRPFF